jgi:hypothetical protein
LFASKILNAACEAEIRDSMMFGFDIKNLELFTFRSSKILFQETFCISFELQILNLWNVLFKSQTFFYVVLGLLQKLM